MDGLRGKPEGCPTEANTEVWVARLCDIFLVSQNLVSNYVVSGWDGQMDRRMDGWMSPVRQSISILPFIWLPKKVNALLV